MDLWNAYKIPELSTFGKNKIYLTTGNRWNASLAKVQDRSYELARDHGHFLKYSEFTRYVLVKDLMFDLFISMYDVNTRDALVFRTASPLDSKVLSHSIPKHLGMFKNPNLEMRFIGLQNEQETLSQNMNDLRNSNALKKLKQLSVVEVDIFGTETRHLALDLKTGTPYNLLLLNKIYRPGELTTTIAKEEFLKGQSELTFV